MAPNWKGLLELVRRGESRQLTQIPTALAAFAVNAELLGLFLQIIERIKRGLLLFQDFIILRFQFLELLNVLRHLRLLFRVLGGSRRSRWHGNRCWFGSLSNPDDSAGKHRHPEYEYSQCLH